MTNWQKSETTLMSTSLYDEVPLTHVQLAGAQLVKRVLKQLEAEVVVYMVLATSVCSYTFCYRQGSLSLTSSCYHEARTIYIHLIYQIKRKALVGH